MGVGDGRSPAAPGGGRGLLAAECEGGPWGGGPSHL